MNQTRHDSTRTKRRH